MTKVDMFSRIPDIYRGIREFDGIFSAVTTVADKLQDKQSRQKKDFYIYSDDISEDAVDRLAKSMRIDVYGLAYEDKVFKIKSVLLDKRPYNIPNVKNMLNILCGDDGNSFSVDNNSFSTSVKLDLGRKNQFVAVYELLDEIIPANMELNVELLYNLHGDLTSRMHGELASLTHEQIRSNIL